MSSHLRNTIASFTETARSQEEKGIEKYGKPLDPLDNYDWLKMALEEQVDGTTYLVAERIKRNQIVQQIRGIIALYMHDIDPGDLEKLNNLLRQLEGDTSK